jgi:predicted RNA-binding Zn ribbon-like protein
LINSRWSDHLGSGRTYDRLLEPRFRRAFLARWRLKVDDPDDRRAVLDLAGLRRLLRRVLERYGSGRPLPVELRHRLEREMNRAPVALHVAGGKAGMQLSHARSGRDWDIVLSEIATSAVRLMSDRKTVKVCANPDCSWMFIDESKPGTRRWCNVGVCGSLVNVRRFRTAHSRDRAFP